MKMENAISARTLLQGAIDEANAVLAYICQLKSIATEQPEQVATLSSQYEEIVGDEINHLLRFVFKAVELLEIDVPTDGLEGLTEANK